jgi:GH43 family beta-xylosidase
MLSAADTSDLMNPASWKKAPEPVFTQSKENSVFAPGHNSFFKSPDGKEDWILYHANDAPGKGCGMYRSHPGLQPFTWTKDGLPAFGTPVRTKVPLKIPSGISK